MTLHNDAEHHAVIRRSNLVGRIALWSITTFLVSLALAALLATLWLTTPLADDAWFMALHRGVVATVLISGLALFLDLFVLQRFLVPDRDTEFRPLGGEKIRVHVGLTAYNDEACIGDAVREFKACPDVDKVVVVENNSKDRTFQTAVEAGADEVFTELSPGYGACCMRALEEAARDADVIVLCEGDMTFVANDVKKLLAYLENCDLVVGTRATQELRMRGTQMDWLINPANQVVAKLIQTRFWGTRLTDVGCTYRAIRADAYQRLAPQLSVRGNHFSPHMFMEALKLRMRVIEIPVVFRKRAGLSKGVGSNKVKAARVAIRMLALLYKS
jgi:hypothetical protein